MKVRDLMMIAVLAGASNMYAVAAPVYYGPETVMQEQGGAPSDSSDDKKAKKGKKGKKGDKKDDDKKGE